MLAPIVSRLQMMMGKALLAALADDSTAVQLIKVEGLEGEVLDQIERPQNYGLTSVPPAGSQAVLLFMGGNRDHGIAILVASDGDRKKDMAEGEVALWSKFGNYILLKTDKGIEVEAGGESVAVNGSVDATGDLTTETNITASGDISADGDVADATGTLDEVRQDLADFKAQIYNTHTHIGAAPGSPTATPLPLAT